MNKKVAVFILICAIFLSGLGFFLTKYKVRGITHTIKGTETIILDLWIDYIITNKKDIFKTGEYAELMVRNRPHGKLKILEVNCKELDTRIYYLKNIGIDLRRKSGLEPIFLQCRMKLEDKDALSTTNGYLSHGNLIKIASNITLEGKYYYVKGFIVDILKK